MFNILYSFLSFSFDFDLVSLHNPFLYFLLTHVLLFLDLVHWEGPDAFEEVGEVDESATGPAPKKQRRGTPVDDVSSHTEEDPSSEDEYTVDSPKVKGKVCYNFWSFPFALHLILFQASHSSPFLLIRLRLRGI